MARAHFLNFILRREVAEKGVRWGLWVNNHQWHVLQVAITWTQAAAHRFLNARRFKKVFRRGSDWPLIGARFLTWKCSCSQLFEDLRSASAHCCCYFLLTLLFLAAAGSSFQEGGEKKKALETLRTWPTQKKKQTNKKNRYTKLGKCWWTQLQDI